MVPPRNETNDRGSNTLANSERESNMTTQPCYLLFCVGIHHSLDEDSKLARNLRHLALISRLRTGSEEDSS
jgi:hypothetical protein